MSLPETTTTALIVLDALADGGFAETDASIAVSYTHLTLPTKSIE